MNTTTHAHRLYLVLVLAAATLTVMTGSATAGTDVPRGEASGVELDAWVSGAARNTPQSAGVDAWARREAAPPVAYDAWTSGQLREASNLEPKGLVGRTPATPLMTPGLLVAGLLSAAVLGALAAVAVGHRRRTPSAR